MEQIFAVLSVSLITHIYVVVFFITLSSMSDKLHQLAQFLSLFQLVLMPGQSKSYNSISSAPIKPCEGSLLSNMVTRPIKGYIRQQVRTFQITSSLHNISNHQATNCKICMLIKWVLSKLVTLFSSFMKGNALSNSFPATFTPGSCLAKPQCVNLATEPPP